jgi:hypothetical protein
MLSCGTDLPTSVRTEHGIEVGLQFPDTVQSGAFFNALLSYTNHTDGNMYVDARFTKLTVFRGGRGIAMVVPDSTWGSTEIKLLPGETLGLQFPCDARYSQTDEPLTETGEYVARMVGEYDYWTSGQWFAIRVRVEDRFWLTGKTAPR